MSRAPRGQERRYKKLKLKIDKLTDRPSYRAAMPQVKYVIMKTPLIRPMTYSHKIQNIEAKLFFTIKVDLSVRTSERDSFVR